MGFSRVPPWYQRRVNPKTLEKARVEYKENKKIRISLLDINPPAVADGVKTGLNNWRAQVRIKNCFKLYVLSEKNDQIQLNVSYKYRKTRSRDRPNGYFIHDRDFKIVGPQLESSKRTDFRNCIGNLVARRFPSNRKENNISSYSFSFKIESLSKELGKKTFTKPLALRGFSGEDQRIFFKLYSEDHDFEIKNVRPAKYSKEIMSFLRTQSRDLLLCGYPLENKKAKFSFLFDEFGLIDKNYNITQASKEYSKCIRQHYRLQRLKLGYPRVLKHPKITAEVHYVERPFKLVPAKSFSSNNFYRGNHSFNVKRKTKQKSLPRRMDVDYSNKETTDPHFKKYLQKLNSFSRFQLKSCVFDTIKNQPNIKLSFRYRFSVIKNGDIRRLTPLTRSKDAAIRKVQNCLLNTMKYWTFRYMKNPRASDFDAAYLFEARELRF